MPNYRIAPEIRELARELIADETLNLGHLKHEFVMVLGVYALKGKKALEYGKVSKLSGLLALSVRAADKALSAE